MKVILEETSYDKIWKKVVEEFRFNPRKEQWISFSAKCKKYKLNSIWGDLEEKCVNSIMLKVIGQDMYALDWQHDCFIYNPIEEIPLNYSYYDEERNVNVYFPSYYPNGDFYFFSSLDWSLGIYGHPWKSEIVVVGEKMISNFEKSKEVLNITEI